MANEVVHYSSDETGAPTMNNVAGSMINVLDACLINGFNVKPVTSLTVSGGVATATVSAHGYASGRIVEFDGATPAGLNGRKKITVVDANTVTFPAAGVSDQTAAGTITCKRPGLGWTKLFNAAGKAIYQRTDPQATAMLLRVDDTAAGVASATQARARMLESATGIDDISTSAFSGTDGQYWSKGQNTATAKQWLLVGDGRTFYFWTDNNSYGIDTGYPNRLHLRGFGDIAPYRAGDAYACVIMGDYGSAAESTAPNIYVAGSAPSNGNGFVLARRADTVWLSPWAMLVGPLNGTLSGAGGPTYPSPVDNGLVILPQILVAEENSTFGHPARGSARGLMLPQAAVGNRLHRRVLSNLIGTDRDVLLVGTMTQGNDGCMAVDITGPWG